MKTYDLLARAVMQEGVRDCFALLGDANMHFAGALADMGVTMTYTRHEHAAVAAATAYARAQNTLGLASVTCGPGLTQIMTALPAAVRARIPLVIFAGEAPLNKAWYNQAIDQAPFVTACGAQYHALHDPDQMLTQIRDAFVCAKRDRIPVVLGVPFDLQCRDWVGGMRLPPPSDTILSPVAPMAPIADDHLAGVVDMITAARRPIVLAGLGAVWGDARADCIALAQQIGGFLATTLPARGLFAGQDYNLGIAGGFAPDAARHIFAQADLVIGVGARLSSHTFDGGALTPNAKVVQIDTNPAQHQQGRKAADVLVQSDARLGVRSLLARLPKQVKNWRTDALKTQVAAALHWPDDPSPDAYHHPMAVVKALDKALPAHCHLVNSSGHCSYFFAQMPKRAQSHFLSIREFGAIGNGTSYALGVARAYPDRPVVLCDGDGSVLMHIQELETLKRHRAKVLIVVMNDGAYGSEVHKLRADGAGLHGAVFGHTDIAQIASGFGIAAHRVDDLADLPECIGAYIAGDWPMLLDIHVSDQIASPQIHRAHRAAHHDRGQ